MEATKLQVKFFVETPDKLELDRYVAVWHEWIRDKVLDELLIDVADYGHVHNGPGILLVGHAADYYMDLGGGRPGLLYSRKRDTSGDPQARVDDALRRGLIACQKLEAEQKLGVRFRGDELLFRINDRLRAPNTESTFEIVRPALDAALKKLFHGDGFSMHREGTARELFSVRIKAPGAPPAAELLQRLV
jgi:hypothetical protein